MTDARCERAASETKDCAAHCCGAGVIVSFMRQELVASRTPSRGSWTALPERSDKSVGVDDESVLQNHAVGVDRYKHGVPPVR